MSMVKIHNVETGEVIEREMNEEELAAFELNKKENAKMEKAEKAKVELKAALLERLGITEDEAKLLLG